MLLTFFEICMGVIGILMFFVDSLISTVLFGIVIIPSIIEALIRVRIYSKHTFQCKDCGKSFSMKGYKLFNVYAPWRMPIRVKQGKEIESRIYGRSHIKCPECGSWECVLLLDE